MTSRSIASSGRLPSSPALEFGSVRHYGDAVRTLDHGARHFAFADIEIHDTFLCIEGGDGEHAMRRMELADLLDGEARHSRASAR